jgi:arylsulfatase
VSTDRQREPGGLRNGDPAAGYGGTIGRTLRDSTPWWPPSATPAANAPDIVIVLLDDLGYSDFGCFGAEISTPNIDALAANGLRFSNYTTVPMCTPARAALLTGKNPHAVGAGWLTFNTPGYPGYQAGEIARDAPTLAELVRDLGYATYCVGKWHNTPDYKSGPSSDRSSWPLARGFDRFYGFIGGETHYFAPAQLTADNAIVDRDTYSADYYCTDDWTETAMRWLKAHISATPDKPLLLYLPFNAPHAPLQAKREDAARYSGVYDAGWDAMRAARVERQRAMGLIAEEWRYAPRSAGVPEWNALDGDRKRVAARFMQLYAAIVDNIDWNIGRLLELLASLGRLDNTLFVVTSDNGANGIGGIDGAVNNLAKRLDRTENPEMVRRMMEEGRIGASDTWPAYPLGWTDVSSAPFRFCKTTTMNGGIRVPLVAHWPKRITKHTGIRHQWVHVTDIVPTILDLCGARYPAAFNGYRTRGLDGVSFAALLDNPDATSLRTRQHYELAGNRGYIADGYKIVSLQPPGKPIDLDNWMLFDLERDATEVCDVARERPEKVAELVKAFDDDARRNYVYPLDNRDVRRSLTIPPFLEEDVDRARTFYPNAGTAALSVVAPLIADRDYRLRCRFAHRSGDTGVVFAIGDPLAGMALFVNDGRACFVYRGGPDNEAVHEFTVPYGVVSFELLHQAQGKRRGRGMLRANEQALGSIDMSPTTILGLGVGEGLDIGLDRKLHVTSRYGRADPFAYTNTIDFVSIEPGAHPADSYANRRERLAQRD